ncbi:Two component system histidine kinase, PAS domain-containing [Desulfonema magnum]|uniref:histidine kinase n=1 Tax=Desulfonema magnum TaxID=45655 RepID=A0A975BF13_9BACT|nr:Two component system histidine kinase, PAS domain-containing [Desulfonema magnum]
MKNLRHSLVLRLIFAVGVTLLISISTWAYFSIRYQQKKFMQSIVEGTDRLTNTIKLGTHYAMMINSRDEINQIIRNIGRQKEIENIRIYNKDGQIKFSNRDSDIEQITNIKAEACYICHRSEPALYELELAQRTRIFTSPRGYRLLGVISPINNEPGCSSECHFHPKDKKILGALDVVVSLKGTDADILRYEEGIISLTVFVFLVTSVIIFIIVLKFVKQPIKKLIDGTHLIAKGAYYNKVDVHTEDEIGELAMAINSMGKEIGDKQAKLNRQRDEYQQLFENVPCIITVQDRNYRLLGYNREFSNKFNPKKGDMCFHAYKGRDKKCENCPVEKTFEDGESHYSEEAGVNKDGTLTHWIVRTAPLRNNEGEIVAAMEMCLDITPRKQLEEQLEKSEKKYHAFFSNIPNPVFVLDAENLQILDCNESIRAVYGYEKNEIVNTHFTDLFMEDKKHYAREILTKTVIDQVKHMNKAGNILFVNIRISPAEYGEQKVFLVTTSDITKRLETEQQLIQTSKMATLGEMATGVAHELNQPLSVIKTASSFFMKKIRKKETIREDILLTMSQEIDSHVDRATKIINHMREFGRKSDMCLAEVQVNGVLQKAFEIFSQQLKLRGIEVVWDLEENLPRIMGDPGRLEQVFINLIINARDAIEARWEFNRQEMADPQEEERKIFLRTKTEGDKVVIEVEDTGNGISPEIRTKIFEPFFTTKEVGKGTGLGLSISYGIIKDCGGTIRTRRNKGKGAFFVIQFSISEK